MLAFADLASVDMPPPRGQGQVKGRWPRCLLLIRGQLGKLTGGCFITPSPTDIGLGANSLNGRRVVVGRRERYILWCLEIVSWGVNLSRNLVYHNGVVTQKWPLAKGFCRTRKMVEQGVEPRLLCIQECQNTSFPTQGTSE